MFLLTGSPESGGGGGGSFFWDPGVYDAWNPWITDPYENWNNPNLTGGGFPVIEYPGIDPNTGLPKFTVTKTETLPKDTPPTDIPPPLNINLTQRPDTINLGGGGGYNTNEPPVIDPNTGMPTWQVTTYGQNPADNPATTNTTDNPANMGATMIIGPSRGGNMGATWIDTTPKVDMGTTLITTKPEDKKTDTGVVTNLPIINPPANNFGDPRGQYRDPRTLGITTNLPIVLPPGGGGNNPFIPPPGGQVNNWPITIDPRIPPIVLPPPGGGSGGKPPGGGGGTTTVQNPLLSILPSMLSAASSAPAAAQPAPLVGEQGYQTIFSGGPQKTQPVPPLAYLMRPQYPRGLF